jgi:DNA-binding GntR family transcriptional regulator
MITRKPLREDIKREIRHRLVDGRLPPGARLHESRLSAELQVSRTPLREAMLGLEAAGFLTSDPGRGFLVPALDRGQFLDLGAMLGPLEVLALETSPIPGSRRMMELQNLLGRARLAAAGGAPEAASVTAGLLTAWASQAYAECPNQSLVADILRCETLCARYWHAAVLAGFRPGTLLAGLDDLLVALRGPMRAGAATTWTVRRSAAVEEAAALLP